MCEPLTIASLALGAGSMVANQVAANKVEKARNGAMAAERIRQNALDQESNALNAQSQDRYTDFQGEQGQKASELGQYFQDQNVAIPSDAPTETMPSTTSSNIVVQEQAKQNAKARAYGDQQGAALGNLRAFGDLLGGISRDQARDAAQIGTIGGFKKGSAGVLPLELEAANSKGNGLKMFGDLLGLGSTVTGGIGASNAAAGGASIFSSPIQGPIMPGVARPRVPNALGNFFGVGDYGVYK